MDAPVELLTPVPSLHSKLALVKIIEMIEKLKGREWMASWLLQGGIHEEGYFGFTLEGEG